MKIHIGAGSRFVEVEFNDGNYSLGALREFVINLYNHLTEPRIESGAVGFIAERGDIEVKGDNGDGMVQTLH